MESIREEESVAATNAAENLEEEAAPLSLTDSDAPPPLPYPFDEVRRTEECLTRLGRIQALWEQEKLTEGSATPFLEADVVRLRREREILTERLRTLQQECAEVIKQAARPREFLTSIEALDRLHDRHRWIVKMRQEGMILVGDPMDAWFRRTATALHREIRTG